MKSCAYCGKENPDTSTVCVECGTAEFKVATTPAIMQTGASGSGSRLRDVLDDPPRMFRALVLLATGTHLIWFFQYILGGRLISPGVWDALSWHGYGALLPLPTSVGWLFMLVSVAVALGVYSFSKSARWLFTLLVMFGLCTLPLAGVQVQTAFSSFVCLIANMADGAILVMAYGSPLKDRFE